MDEKGNTRVIQMRVAWILIALAYIIVWILPFLADLSGQAHGSAQNLANTRDASHFGWW